MRNDLNERKYCFKEEGFQGQRRNIKGLIEDTKHDWKKDPATNKQLEYILEMHEFSEFYFPPFEGTTKGEAAEYINKYTELAHESIWGIEHGY